MLKDYKIGDKIRQLVIVKVQKSGATANGGVYVRGNIQDNSGTMTFITFAQEAADYLKELSQPAAVVIGTVQADKYGQDGAKQLMLEQVLPVASDADTSQIVPVTTKDISLYQREMQQLIQEVAKPHLRDLLQEIFRDELLHKFLKSPAAMRHHHAYHGGLLEHSVDVAKLAKAMAGECIGVDVDLVITGALLHDIGKIKEISPEVGFEYTDTGKFIGHMVLGALQVEKSLMKFKDFPRQDALELMHILLSHHGSLDKGSPVPSSTRESLLVHYADEVNSMLNQFDSGEQAGKNEWRYNRMMGHNIYIKN